ncbi:MAG: hypothetical protein ACI4U1_05305, partial [Anaerovoracaceae bacterium]
MYKEALRPVWAEINLSNLDYNIKNIKAKIGDREMIGVIKACSRPVPSLKRHCAVNPGTRSGHPAADVRGWSKARLNVAGGGGMEAVIGDK